METRSANTASGSGPTSTTTTTVAEGTGPNICRICLANGTGTGQGKQPGPAMESIFAPVREYEGKTMYELLAEVCAPLGQRDMVQGGPERICRGCKWRLLSAYDLYETCLRSDERIREVADSRGVVKQQTQPEKPDPEPIQIKQEITEGDEPMSDAQLDTTFEDYPNTTSFLLESQFLPDADSSHHADSTKDNLLEEMTPAEPVVDPNETFFEMHYKTNGEGSHVCDICEQDFPYKSSARTHIITKHDPTKPFKCDVCFITLTTELRLIRHKAVYHGVGVIKCDKSAEGKDESTGDTIFTCKICSKTFASLIRFKRHKNVHVAFNRPFKCDVCLYRFASRAQLTQHAKSHLEKEGGDGEPMDWKCEHCEEKLPNKRAVTMHIRRFHPSEALQGDGEAREKNEYKCIICSQEFARESVLNTHMKMHELLAMEKEKEHRAEVEMLVKKELQQSKLMLEGQMQQRKPSVEIVPATTGGELYGGTSGMNSSVGITSTSSSTKKRSDADVAFVCMVCEQEFEEREMLLKHQKKLHKELQVNIVSGGQEQENTDDVIIIDDDDYPNDIAARSFTEDDPMVIDVDPAQLLAGGGGSENGTPKRTFGGSGGAGSSLHKCDICQRTFLYNCLLQTHIKKSHSESKPFECKVCHMRFGYRGSLQKHELTHSAQKVRPGEHGSIMYKCKVCQAKFLELKMLTFHLRSHRSGSGGSALDTPTGPPKKVEIFACNMCPQIFSAKDEFERHLVGVHRQNVPHSSSSVSQQMPPLRKIPEQRKPPMNEKELFFDSLAIVKLEHPLQPLVTVDDL